MEAKSSAPSTVLILKWRYSFLDGLALRNTTHDATGLDLHSDDYDSIGGYLIEHLGRLARKGDRVRTREGYLLIADRVDLNRIQKVRLFLPAISRGTEDTGSPHPDPEGVSPAEPETENR